jgi:prepilin-type N-terminal cleavage/methylation domain-containing protein
MTRKGFTLIELLVVIVIIGILVAIALPNFIRIKDKAKEAEVKQNLHAIQLSLERYSVDSEGSVYPLYVYGGDWQDTYTVWQSWLDTQNMDITMIANPDRQARWVPAGNDMGDIMMMEAYMPSYPGNPFLKQKSNTILPLIWHYPGPYPGGGPYEFTVGGRESNKMWECFGPVWLAPGHDVAGDLWVHHVYNNPPYNAQGDVTKNPPGGWVSPSGNRVLVGNFSYWVRGADGATGFAFLESPEAVGYTLAGYGSLRTAGQDVYNRNGNYKGRYRTESCEYECAGYNAYPDVPCICNTGAAPSRAANNGGSDTISDGAVITLDSGVDSVSKRTNAEQTQGEGY